MKNLYSSLRLPSNWRRLILPVLTLFSFATAFLRDILFAKQLGAGLESDAIWLALILPAIFEQIIGGPMRDAMIARLSSQTEPRNGRYKFMITLTLSVSAVVMLTLWTVQDPLSQALTPGWSEEAQILGLHIIAIGLLMVPGHTVYYAQWAFAASAGRFALAHSRSVWLNVAAILACIVFPGDPFAIIWGMVTGTVLHAVAMELMLIGLKFKTDTKTQNKPQKTTGLLHLITFSISALAPQICVLLERSLASGISAGSITHLSIAYRLSTIVLSITVASFIVPIYADLERLSGSSKREFWGALSRQLRWILLLIIPTCVVFLALSEEITQLLFLRGEFLEQDVKSTAAALRSYTWGVPFFCLILVMIRSLLALRAAIDVIIAAGVMFVSYLVLVYGFDQTSSVAQLALSFTMSQILYAIILFGCLIRKIGWNIIAETFRFKSKIT